jgi:hypothetical protein
MLSSHANRGVINSSVTGAGINNLSSNAADAYNKNYLSALNSVMSGLGSTLQGSQANAQTLLGTASGYDNIPDTAFSNAGAMLMPAYNMWDKAQTLYDNREDFDTVVTNNKDK